MGKIKEKLVKDYMLLEISIDNFTREILQRRWIRIRKKIQMIDEQRVNIRLDDEKIKRLY